jgi:hypothetical protein
MDVLAQVKADVPLALKRRTFSALALQGKFFNKWLEEQMQRWLDEVEREAQQPASPSEVTDGSER